MSDLVWTIEFERNIEDLDEALATEDDAKISDALDQFRLSMRRLGLDDAEISDFINERQA